MKACLLLVAAVLICRWKLRVASSTMDCGRDLKLDAWFHSQMLELWTPSMQFLPIEQALIDSPLFSTYFDAQGQSPLPPGSTPILTQSNYRELDLRTTNTKNLTRGLCHNNPTGGGEISVFTFYTENSDLGPGSESHRERNYTGRMAYEAALRGRSRETLGCIRWA